MIRSLSLGIGFDEVLTLPIVNMIATLDGVFVYNNI